jgi:oxygen-independent coproporphyrinogen-3 oxidase
VDAVPAGLYIHFPFCRRKCPYCHFVSGPIGANGLAQWRRGLELEADRYADAGLEFDTLYIGGGTPSLLEPTEGRGILESLKARLSLRLKEVTLEANPSTEAGADRLAGWLDAGVTRLSVGVQSLDDGILETLGRDYGADTAAAFLRSARRAGFRSLGLDLMIGVPGESKSALQKTLDGIAEFEPEHVSLYILENVDGLPFEKTLRARPVDDDETADRFERAAEKLAALDLRRYEISNFARPGHECRHNLKYWRYEPFLGLGPSAASHIGAERWADLEGLEAWMAALAAGRDPRAETIVLDAETAVREALVAGLRLVRGIDGAEFRRRFGVDILHRFAREIDDLRRDGFLVFEDGFLRIPERRLLVSNAVLARFV